MERTLHQVLQRTMIKQICFTQGTNCKTLYQSKNYIHPNSVYQGWPNDSLAIEEHFHKVLGTITCNQNQVGYFTIFIVSITKFCI